MKKMQSLRKHRRRLKLTDKEKETIKAQATDLEKDMREIYKDVGRDPEKRAKAQKKVAELRKKAMDSITKSLTADQQKAWKEMTGEHFDYKPEFPGGSALVRNRRKTAIKKATSSKPLRLSKQTDGFRSFGSRSRL